MLVLVLGLAAAPGALAAKCPQTTLGDVENEVMCPVCGTPLALAEEAPQAERERAFIERMVDACRSKSEIKRALVAQYGEAVLALPGDEGDDSLSDLLAYLVPLLAVLLSATGIVLAARRWRRRPQTSDVRRQTSDASPRLDRDMDRYDL